MLHALNNTAEKKIKKKLCNLRKGCLLWEHANNMSSTKKNPSTTLEITYALPKGFNLRVHEHLPINIPKIHGDLAA